MKGESKPNKNRINLFCFFNFNLIKINEFHTFVDLQGISQGGIIENWKILYFFLLCLCFLFYFLGIFFIVWARFDKSQLKHEKRRDIDKSTVVFLFFSIPTISMVDIWININQSSLIKCACVRKYRSVSHSVSYQPYTFHIIMGFTFHRQLLQPLSPRRTYTCMCKVYNKLNQNWNRIQSQFLSKFY